MTAEPGDILSEIGSMEKEIEAIEDQVTDICYWMRGGITFNEGWALSHQKRQRITKSLNEKIRKQSGDTTEYM